jgi:hypothetical protein
MHQWYWSYPYLDFLNTDEEFIEFDPYLIPESGDNSTRVYLDTVCMSNSSSNIILPSYDELSGSIAEQESLRVIKEKLLSQFEFNKQSPHKRNFYSNLFPSHMVLNSDERHYLAAKYIDSGDKSYIITQTRAELRITMKSGAEFPVTLKLINIISR